MPSSSSSAPMTVEQRSAIQQLFVQSVETSLHVASRKAIADPSSLSQPRPCVMSRGLAQFSSINRPAILVLYRFGQLTLETRPLPFAALTLEFAWTL